MGKYGGGDPSASEIAGIAGRHVGAIQLIRLAWWIRERYGATNQTLKTVLPRQGKDKTAREKTLHYL